MSGLPEFQNRTLICSVLFLAIADHSRKSAADRSALKERLNALLSTALRGVPINDRIILDTADGAAISFIGDPEDALSVATALRDLIESASEGAAAELWVRMGINLGPVRLVKDIDGQPNIIGDGINAAQLVMTFAKPGQVLVSRSYYEVVSRLSGEASTLFSYEGVRTDRHVREHEVYAVGSAPAPRARPKMTPHGEAWGTSGALMTPAGGLKQGLYRLLRSSALASLVAVLVIVSIAFAVRDYREERSIAQARLAAAERQSAQTRVAPLPPIRGMPPEPARSAERQKPDAGASAFASEAKDATRDKPKPSEKAALTQEALRRPRTAAVQDAAPAAASATLTFAVSPWGEVHVNGKLEGVSPPLHELEIGPGRYRIEIKNGVAQPHVVNVNAKSGEHIRIKHKFE